MGRGFTGQASRVLVRVWLSLCFFFCTAWSASLNQTILQELLQNLKGNGSSSTWDTSNSNPCTWKGVGCSGSVDVTKLSLSGYHLGGFISPDIGLLQHLITIDLSGNSLTGNIPPNLFDCASLSTLNLSSNLLTGPIPTGLEKLNRLQSLDLSQNKLNGFIPAGIGNLTSLQKLSLDSNQLTGSIPADFINLTSITDLSLSKNSLTGAIPNGISDLLKLESFSADHNNLTGSIPSSMPTLKSLNLASNRLEGAIPLNMCASGQLAMLILTSNSLDGPSPQDLGSCITLSNLRLGENSLNGTIPESLVQLQNLVYFEANQNNLSGQIPPNISGWRNLSLLNLARNSLGGAIPTQLSQALVLQEVRLANNKFSGGIPLELSQCKNLSSLDLSGNQLTGSLPDNICTGLPKLASLLLDDNSLTGAIPSSIGDCAQLLELQLGDNQLNGSIPPQIGNLFNLQVSLNLSLNELTGSIPDRLGNLVKLVSLDLSHNKLSGSIPDSLSGMVSLLDWNFSNNLLTGPVPTSGTLKNSSASSYANNTGLCGGPLSPCGVTSPASSNGKRNTLTFWKVAGIAIACGALVELILVLGYITYNWCGSANGINDNQMEEVGEGYMRLSQQELVHITGGFNDGTVIGAGGLSTVYSASLADGRQVAVKRLSMDKFPQAKKAFMTELRVLSRVRHRNITKVLGFTWGPEVKALLLELMPNGSLHKHLHEIRPCRLHWSARLQIAMGVAQALAYLHSDLQDFAVVHCDVKPSNILLDLDMSPKLSDLGVARMIFSLHNYGFMDSSTTSDIVRGSLGYIAPEYAFSRKLAPQADVFSFGMVLLELITGRRPTDHEYFQSTKACTLRGWVHESLEKSKSTSNYIQVVLDPVLKLSRFPLGQVMRLTSVALKCSSENPAGRPTMREVIHALEDLCGARTARGILVTSVNTFQM